ncbi:MAG TPA: PIN domain-containing protein [Candidatus Limnocylindrales bacterium]
MPTLIDSDVFIDVLDGDDRAIEFLVLARRSDAILSVTPVRTEVLGGLRVEQVRPAMRLLGLVQWLDVTVELADVAAGLTRRHRPAHSGIGVVDYILAAAAIEVDGIVATRNVRHFPMFPGLQPPY